MKPAGWYYLTPAQCSAISLSIGNLYLDGDYPGERAARAAQKIVLGSPLRLTPAEYAALTDRIEEGSTAAEARFGDDNALTARELDSIERGESKLYNFAHPTTRNRRKQ